MGFYGIISMDVELKNCLSEQEKKEIINTLSEFVNFNNDYDNELYFSEESNFSYGITDDLKSILEKLKANNKIEDATINIWYLEEPDETIYV